MTEEWRCIPGYGVRYQVSDQGRVRSLFRAGMLRAEPRIHKGFWQRGYHRVLLAGRNRSVHQLVLEAFIGPRPAGFIGGHLNGNPGDNRPANLAWITYAENSAHRVLHGTSGAGIRPPPERVLRGEAHGRAVLTEADVIVIRAAIAAGEAPSVLAKHYGVAIATVVFAADGRSWSHVPGAVPVPRRWDRVAAAGASGGIGWWPL